MPYNPVTSEIASELRAIVGEKKKAHYIVDEKCIRCGTCSDVCRFSAVSVN